MAAETSGNCRWRTEVVGVIVRIESRTYVGPLELPRVPSRASLVGSFNDLECLIDFNLLDLKRNRVSAMI